MMMIRAQFVLVLNGFILISFVQAFNESDISRSDQYGNIVFRNKSVHWKTPISVGNWTYKSTPQYSVTGFEAYFACVRGFINFIQPSNFHFTIVKKAFTGELDVKRDYKEILNSAIGLVICVATGVAFIIFFPLCGCCFFCLRCCGKCGGKRMQQHSRRHRCRRTCLTTGLLMLSMCIAISPLCVTVSGNVFRITLDNANTTVINSLDNVMTYLTNTAQLFTYIVVDMYNLIADAVMADIEDLGTIVGNAVLDILNVDDIVDNVVEVDASIHDISAVLATVTSNVEALKTSTSDLTNALNQLADDIDSTKTTCSGYCVPDQCGDIDTSLIRQSLVDLSALPDLSPIQTSVDTAISSNMTSDALNMQTSLREIPILIANKSKSVKHDVNVTLQEFAKELRDLADEAISRVSEKFPINKAKNTTKDIITMANHYDTYRQHGSTGLTTVFSILVVLLVLAVISGWIGHNKYTLPTHRSCVSNCGGRVILGAIFFMFLIGSPLMMVTTVMFVVGGSLQKLCEPILNLDMFQQVIDDGEMPVFDLGVLLFDDASMKIRLRDVLIGCRDNQSPYTLLHLDHLVSLDEFANYTQYLKDADVFLDYITTINISSYSLLSSATTSALGGFAASVFNNVDFVSAHSALNNISDTVSTSFNQTAADSFVTAMKGLQAKCAEPVKGYWAAHVTEVDNIQTIRIPAVYNAITMLNSSLISLQTRVSGLTFKINFMLKTVSEADDKLHNQMTTLLTEAITTFRAGIESYLSSYRRRTLNVIHNELGACRPLWNIYRSFTDMMCTHVVDAVNGLWFGVGWALFFFIPTIIVGVKLSKFFLRMNTVSGYNEFDELLVKNVKRKRRNRVEATF